MAKKKIPINPGEKIWPADKVERWNVADLIPSAQNAKEHSPAQVEEIAKSIDEFGFTVPVLVDEAGELIAGHGRVLAARLRAIEFVPTMVAVGWTEAQKRAYRIADNRLTEMGKWDRAKLSKELKALAEMGSEKPTGFSAAQIKALIAKSDAGAAAITIDPIYQVLIECDTEMKQREVLETLAELGIKCRALIA